MVAVVSLGSAATPALAQGGGANSGAITWSANVDVPSVYVFRGMVQERDPAATVQPSGDLQIAFGKMMATLSTWHSLQSGSSGSKGPTGRLHYEERLAAGFSVPTGAGTTLTTTYTAYTAPGNLFETRHEVGLRLASRQMLKPYGLVAVELKGAADGIADGHGSYLELGVGPALPLSFMRGTLTVPARVGVSLKNYYQGFDGDHRFGFFDVGGLLTVPLNRSGGAYGRWNLHGGVDVYLLGDTPKVVFNNGSKTKIVGLVGLGLRY